MTWTHDALQEDLAQHLREKTQRLVWSNMPLGPAHSPRPDAYSVPFSFSRFTPLAYEVKISVSDYRRDVAAGKWQSYLRYAAGVIFAVPAGLIGKADLPEGCGLMARTDEGWRTLKAPTLRPVDNLPLDAWIKLMIDGLAREVDRRMPKASDEYRAISRIEQRLGREVGVLLRDRHLARHRYARATDKMAKRADEAERAYQAAMQTARDRAGRDAARLDSARTELAEALGLPPDAHVHAIVSAAQAAARRLDGDAEIRRLRNLLERVQSAFEDASAQLPAIARVA